MKWILFFCVGTLVAAAPPSLESESSLTFPERYLFLVETSASMKKQDAAARQALFDLVHWGVDGHMQGGDTYGIWTFNEDAYPGLFPMQIWDPGQQLALGTRASLFLKEQPFAGNTHMSKVVLKLLSIVMTVKDVNVLVITDGSEPIAGTAFDTQIKAEVDKRLKDARRTKKPFVISLSARGGDVTGWSVTLAGEQLQLPARQILPERTNATPAGLATAAVTASTNAPAKPIGKIISLGYIEEPLTAKTASGLPPVVVSVTAPPAQIDPLLPVISNSSAGTGTSFTSPRPPTPALKAEPEPDVVIATSGQPGDSAKNSDPLPTTATNNRGESSKPTGRSPARYSPDSTEPLSDHSAAVRDRSSGAAEAAVESKSMPVAAREPQHVTPTALAVSVVPAVEPLLSAKELLIAGIVLFLAAVGLVFIFLRRAQPAVQQSFITRSMDKQP